jgi:hypothetical protein
MGGDEREILVPKKNGNEKRNFGMSRRKGGINGMNSLENEY